MNKLLLLSRIKGLIFVLMSSAEYNIDFIYHPPHKKKAGELSFYSTFKTYVLIVSTLAFAFKIIRPIIFQQSRKKVFYNFSTITELFHSQGTFPLSRNFSTVKELFHSKGTVP